MQYYRKLLVNSYCLSKGQKLLGVEAAPNVLQKHGLINILNKKRIYGTFHRSGVMLNNYDCLEANKMIFKDINKHMNSGYQMLNIGGDHSISIGTISAMNSLYPDHKIVWIDAHPDINTHASSPSGNIHGMSMAYLMGIEKNAFKYDWLKNYLIDPSNVIYIGLRDIDPEEKSIIKCLENQGLSVYYMDDVRNSLKDVMNKVMQDVNNNFLHVSFDVDSLDPSLTPATGTPVENGLTMEEATYIMEKLREGNILSVDLVEINPQKEGCSEEDVEKTCKNAIHLIEKLFS